VLEKRQKTPAVIQVLEELTRVLPDDTWVQTLDIKGKELQIQGETASSVRLIGLFEQSSVFKDSSFRSPLTKGQVSGTERYQLALQIRPPALPTVAPAPEASSSAPAMPQTPVSAPQALVAVEKKP
jgi:general secretion pathway protein L